MPDVLEQLTDRIKILGSDWTKYSVVGSFVLYVAGYLALRFHLTAIGVGTDLAVLDERYLFTGARFVVYLVASVPNLVLMGLPLAAAVWAAGKIPGFAPAAARWWLTRPTAFAIAGIVFAVLTIQFVMRQVFLISDLLLTRRLPPAPSWLVALLVDDRLMPLYFTGLVAACVVPLVILAGVRGLNGHAWLPAAKGLLSFLVAVQLLLLPINYGVLIVDQVLPRVTAIGDKPMTGSDEAWLVWEGKDGMTFLVRTSNGGRSLVTVPRSEIKRTEIVGFDRIVPALAQRDSMERP